MSAAMLRYGIQLPIQTLTKLLREPWELDATVGDLVTVTQAAEAAGCSFVGVCDHVAIPDDEYGAHMTPVWWESLTTLAFLAAHTSTVQMLTVVYNAAYRHPLVSAKAFMTLDHLSGGRAIVGVGAGHVEGEFAALGLDFRKRGLVLDENIDAMRAAFDNEWTEFAGEFYDYGRVGLAPRPVQQQVPIWIGGGSKPALRRVAERGDGWIPAGNPREQMQECVDYIRAHRDKVRPAAQLDLGFMPEWIYVGEPGWDIGTGRLSGSPERIAESLRAAHGWGCSVLHLRFRSRSRDELCDQLAAFGRDVAPLLGP